MYSQGELGHLWCLDCLPEGSGGLTKTVEGYSASVTFRKKKEETKKKM